uniref:Uncharacterized protein n=1 Tax=Romanomermis culicivorax TaxID=13658 RepID=A0A915IPM4_ROMCU
MHCMEICPVSTDDLDEDGHPDHLKAPIKEKAELNAADFAYSSSMQSLMGISLIIDCSMKKLNYLSICITFVADFDERLNSQGKLLQCLMRPNWASGAHNNIPWILLCENIDFTAGIV